MGLRRLFGLNVAVAVRERVEKAERVIRSMYALLFLKNAPPENGIIDMYVYRFFRFARPVGP